jgi:virginiamycin A acetyltransferase
MKYLSTYQSKTLFNGELKTLRTDEKVTIGNDVWIGHSVIILSGVTISDGAIIGGGSVVTKDIPPFAVAAGVPAKVIKYRFKESTRDEITEMQWWNKEPYELEDIKDEFFKKL